MSFARAFDVCRSQKQPTGERNQFVTDLKDVRETTYGGCLRGRTPILTPKQLIYREGGDGGLRDMLCNAIGNSRVLAVSGPFEPVMWAIATALNAAMISFAWLS
jgi:hypothetical protein